MAYLKGGENRMSELLGSLDHALRESGWRQRPFEAVVDIAKGINRIRLNHGDDHERLTKSFGYSHLHGNASYIDDAWGRTNPMRFTPNRLAVVAADVRNGIHSSTLATFW